MTNYLIRRSIQMLFVVFLSSVAIYLLLNLAPGGPLAGIRVFSGTDVKSQVSEAQIAQLQAYLGLDKPLWLRYVSWLVGDDWVGADWMYLGLTPYRYAVLDDEGQQVTRRNASTGDRDPVFANARFWANPGVAQLNPGYDVYVLGEQVGERLDDHPINPFLKDVQYIELGNIETVYVRASSREDLPQGGIAGRVLGGTGYTVWIEPVGGARIYELQTTPDTSWDFPLSVAQPRPADGLWLNISWLTGPSGVLGSLANLHGDNRGILRLDWGFSWKLAQGQSVLDIIQSRLGNTLLLMTTATVVSLVVAIPIGIYSAVNQYSRLDYFFTTFSFFGSAMPVFWFGLMMILLFAHNFKNWGLPYMPTGGVASVRTPNPGSILSLLNAEPGGLVDRLVHIVMPAAVLSLLYMAGWSRFTRTSMLEVLRQDYVRTARAKGLTERVVIAKHALRNALIPLITIVVFQIPSIFGGAILTETIFSYPGIGRLYFDALGVSDWPIVMVLLFITAILVVLATLIRDVLYTIVDPRIRFS